MIKGVNISLTQTIAQVKGNIVSNMDGEKVMLTLNRGNITT